MTSRGQGGAFDHPARLAELLEPPQAPEYGSVFPLGLYRAFLEEIDRRKVRVLTYDDLFAGCDDRDHAAGYADEHEHWRTHLRDAAIIDLVIQHDVDFAPAFTRRLVAMEALHGIRSNIFVLPELPPPPPDSPYDDTPYDVDHAFFQDAERHGFVIGYHQNALSRAGSIERATELFRQDVAEMRRRYAIRCFCPHGGRPVMIDGAPRHNYDVPMPHELAPTLRWVYNRYGLRFSGRYSDGGLRRTSGAEKLCRLDLSAFVKAMAPGRRYFALIHPQYWGHSLNPEYNPALSRQEWYRELCRRHATPAAP